MKKIEIPEGYKAKIEGNKVILEPEESKDERTRKAIGVAICGTRAISILEANGSNLSEALSYLEKQREQKPLSTEETELNSIAFLEQMGYTCIPPKEQESVARENDFVSKPQTSVEILRHYLVWAGNSDEEDCPYTWRTLADAIRDGIKALEEQKSVKWSEENVTNGWTGVDLERYLSCLQNLGTGNPQQPETINSKWFKKHCHPQPKQEWSEEDEKKFGGLYNALITLRDLVHSGELKSTDRYAAEKYYEELASWLKSLRLQPKQEWSKEDENIYNKALDAIYYKDLNDKDEVVDSLKALCDLIARNRKVIPPYARWKPSEEQMGALNYAYCELFKRKDVGHNILGPLQKLIDDLQNYFNL